MPKNFNESKCSDDVKENEKNNFKSHCIHEIKNFKKLNQKVLVDINNLSSEERLEILQTYNQMINYANEILENIK